MIENITPGPYPKIMQTCQKDPPNLNNIDA